jgi:TonB family protein
VDFKFLFYVVVSFIIHSFLWVPSLIKTDLASLNIVERLSGESEVTAQSIKGDGNVNEGDGGLKGDEGLIQKLLSHNPKPPYPAVARRMKLEGTAIVRVLLMEQGHIQSVVFTKKTGHSILDEAIIKTIKNWALPTHLSQKRWLMLPPFEFRLKKDS